MIRSQCEVCGSTDLSWIDQRFGHCNRGVAEGGETGARGRRAFVRDGDRAVEGHHPGLDGYVTSRRDLQRKVDQARREGAEVRRPEECFSGARRPQRDVPKRESAIDKVLTKIRREGLPP